MTMEERQKLYEAKNAALTQSNAEPSLDVLTTVRKRIELVINEIMDTELIAILRTAMRELDLALAQSDAIPVRAFAKAVLHGDDEHRAWLIEAAEAFIAGKPLPPPRGKGTKQSDAEPVGGLAKARTIALEQRCERGTPWDLACVTIANKIGEQCGYPPIPTDTTPPRPDVSAGLIEAAEVVKDWARACSASPPVELLLSALEKELRARAAERSGK